MKKLYYRFLRLFKKKITGKLYITIDNKEYDVPLSYDNLTVEQMMKLAQIDFNKGVPTDNVKLVLCALLDIDIDILNDIDYHNFVDLCSLLYWINEEPKFGLVKSFKFEGNTYKLIDFKKIKLGQFIDLEHYISQGIQSNLNSIIPIIYKTDAVIENPKENCLRMPISQVIGGVLFFCRLGSRS